MPTTLQSMESDNLEVEELSLLSLEQVPEDADCLVINAPQSDFMSQEAVLISYLDEGGRVMLFTDSHRLRDHGKPAVGNRPMGLTSRPGPDRGGRRQHEPAGLRLLPAAGPE